jgi:hypothetical protein
MFLKEEWGIERSAAPLFLTPPFLLRKGRGKGIDWGEGKKGVDTGFRRYGIKRFALLF